MKEILFLLLLLLVVLSLAFQLTLSVAVFDSQSASLLPHAHESFNISYIQMKNAASCSYLVVISTSCSSPRYTTDQISIAFGDAYGNQIYSPRLDDPSSGTFESCSSDTFQINGPCAYQICYVYLYRSGSSGWKPDTVKINGYNGRPVTFYYNTFIPRDTWYGFDLCNNAASSYKVTAQKCLLLVILGFVLSFLL
ncbi:embryo-specific protein ATS3B [Trifolium pratense]|uniref:embryo-specific protein ATS3B n=1 Tax=Trifolium pratense TaxID=57577 RepID=UPI001E690192|nr:embryo-specific protein ATS3B [Trifolium pratense]